MISKGDIVVCPECRIKLYRFTSDLCEGDRISLSDAEPIGKTPIPYLGDPLECWSCNARIHNGCRFIEIERDAHTFQKEKAQV